VTFSLGSAFDLLVLTRMINLAPLLTEEGASLELAGEADQVKP
jgi:hypothetical protein